MRRLAWSAEARGDLHEVISYISNRNPAAAERMLALIEHTAEHLPTHPFLYRPGREPDTREAVVHPNYILVYRVTDEAVRVLALLHARQEYP